MRPSASSSPSPSRPAHGGVAGRLFGRFDLAVAVFFALSGFLLWRGHAAAARGLRPIPSTGHYLRSRVVRIMPAYLVAVVVILTLLPEVKADPRCGWPTCRSPRSTCR